MATPHIHGLKPEHKAKIASVSQDMEDNVFISEEARQSNIDQINQYMEEIKILDERLEKIEASSETKTEQQATERGLRLKRKQLMDIVTDLSVKKNLMNSRQKTKPSKRQKR